MSDERLDLTDSQIKFAEILIETDDRVTAAEMAYPNSNYPSQRAYQILQKPAVREYIRRRLLMKDAHKLVVNKLMDLMEAKKRTSHGWVPDNAAQLQAIKQLAEFLQLGEDRASEFGSKHLHVHLETLEDEPIEVLEYIAVNNQIPDKETRAKLLTDGSDSG